ncbi:MAG: hypothetical protein ACREL7_01900 [Longimicrobiales bacterium]
MKPVAALVFGMSALAGCTEAAPSLRPTFEPVFPPLEGDLMTISSPDLIDLTGDGVLDIVFGTGVDRLTPEGTFSAEPAVSGYVTAVSGATNEVLWSVPNPRDAFTTPRFANLDRDSVPDVIMGGREGAFSAFSGVDGALLWRVAPSAIAETPVPYNFTTPALIRDANADGIADLVVTYGGDATRPAQAQRDPGYVAVVSGADGAILAVSATPDGNETYSSPVVYTRPDSAEWFIFGTGGERHGGTAFRAPLATLLSGTFPRRVEQLIAPGTKGVMAPAVLVDLTDDHEPDIVISTFDGRLLAVDGASGGLLWEQTATNEESYHPAAVVRLGGARTGLFVSRGIGVFPRYAGSVHRLYDAADGRILYEYTDPYYPAGAPLAVDLTGDGIDEPFFFSERYPSAHGARIHILRLPSDSLITHDVATNFWSTPVIADARGAGTLELIGLSWLQKETFGPPGWRDLRWQLLRMDLGVEAPSFRGWAGYMGTNADGIYRRPPARR